VGRYIDAIEAFRRAMELNNEGPQLWIALGRTYREIHDDKAAEECFRSAERSRGAPG